jgi:YHS domain-containing protein
MVVEETKAIKLKVGDRTFYFCSESCQRAFEKNPEKYLRKTSERPEAGSQHHESHSGCCGMGGGMVRYIHLGLMLLVALLLLLSRLR